MLFGEHLNLRRKSTIASQMREMKPRRSNTGSAETAPTSTLSPVLPYFMSPKST